MSDAPELKILGDHIRRLREATGKSQETLGDEAEIHRNAIGAIERGTAAPNALTLLKLARVLGVKPSALLSPFD